MMHAWTIFTTPFPIFGRACTFERQGRRMQLAKVGAERRMARQSPSGEFGLARHQLPSIKSMRQMEKQLITKIVRVQPFPQIQQSHLRRCALQAGSCLCLELKLVARPIHDPSVPCDKIAHHKRVQVIGPKPTNDIVVCLVRNILDISTYRCGDTQ